MRIPKWPFFGANALLVAAAWHLFARTQTPLGAWEIAGYVACVVVGAVLAIIPFVMEHRAQLKLAEADGLTTAVAQMENLQQLAAQIGYATSQWQVVRESADKTAASAREISQGMAAELKMFNEVAQRAQETEKATLRLEVDKLRRAEFEWLQVVVAMLDHVYALHQAALNSRQPTVADQVGRFQTACLDAARRVGLAPFVAQPSERFDEKRHQVEGRDPRSVSGRPISGTLATGYTFQGRLIRPALVQVSEASSGEGDAGAAQPVEPERDCVDQSAVALAKAEDQSQQ